MPAERARLTEPRLVGQGIQEACDGVDRRAGVLDQVAKAQLSLRSLPIPRRQSASADLMEGARTAPPRRARKANLAPENAWLSGILVSVRETFRNAYFIVMVDDTRRLIRRARTEQAFPTIPD